MGESFQCRGSRKGEGEGFLGMWPGIELVGKESRCNVALFRLTISSKCIGSHLLPLKNQKVRLVF